MASSNSINPSQCLLHVNIETSTYDTHAHSLVHGQIREILLRRVTSSDGLKLCQGLRSALVWGTFLNVVHVPFSSSRLTPYFTPRKRTSRPLDRHEHAARPQFCVFASSNPSFELRDSRRQRTRRWSKCDEGFGLLTTRSRRHLSQLKEKMSHTVQHIHRKYQARFISQLYQQGHEQHPPLSPHCSQPQRKASQYT
jgi:hypothetical protein